MTITEALLRRRVGRLAVSLEMILVVATLPMLAYALAGVGLGTTTTMMITSAATFLVIRFYVRALRLDERVVSGNRENR